MFRRTHLKPGLWQPLHTEVSSAGIKNANILADDLELMFVCVACFDLSDFWCLTIFHSTLVRLYSLTEEST